MRKTSGIIAAMAVCLVLAACSKKEETPNIPDLAITDESVASAVSENLSQVRTVIFDSNYIAADIAGSPVISGSKVEIGSTIEIYPVEEYSQIVSIEVNGMIYAGNTASYTVSESDPDEINITFNLADGEEPVTPGDIPSDEREPVEPQPDPLTQAGLMTGDDIPDILRIGGFRFAQPSTHTGSAYIEEQSYNCSLSENGGKSLMIGGYKEATGGLPFKSSDYEKFTDYAADVAEYEFGDKDGFKCVAAEVGGQPALFVTAEDPGSTSYAIMYIQSPDGSDSTFAKFLYTVTEAGDETGSLTDQLVAVITDIHLSI